MTQETPPVTPSTPSSTPDAAPPHTLLGDPTPVSQSDRRTSDTKKPPSPPIPPVFTAVLPPSIQRPDAPQASGAQTHQLNDTPYPIELIQVAGQLSGAPRGTWIIHLTMRAPSDATATTAHDLLGPVLTRLLRLSNDPPHPSSQPRVAILFALRTRSPRAALNTTPAQAIGNNLWILPDPTELWSLDDAYLTAQDIARVILNEPNADLL